MTMLYHVGRVVDIGSTKRPKSRTILWKHIAKANQPAPVLASSLSVLEFPGWAYKLKIMKQGVVISEAKSMILEYAKMKPS